MEGKEPGFAPVPKTLQLKLPQPEPLGLRGQALWALLSARAGGELVERGSHHGGDQTQGTLGLPQ